METPLDVVIHPCSVKVLRDIDPVSSALDAFRLSEISCLPLVKGLSNEPLGFVDALDVVTYFSRQSTANPRTVSLAQLANALCVRNRSPYHALNVSGTVRHAVDLFATRGIHRAAVIDDKNQVKGMVTCHGLLPVLLKETSAFPWMGDTTLGDMKYRTAIDKLVKVRLNEPVTDAFQFMHDKHVSSVAVVDNMGGEEIVVGTLSGADLTRPGILSNIGNLKNMSVADLLKLVRMRDGKPLEWLVCALPTTSIMDALMKLQQHHVSRIFVVDSRRQPQGVVSITDIIRETHSRLPTSAPIGVAPS